MNAGNNLSVGVCEGRERVSGWNQKGGESSSPAWAEFLRILVRERTTTSVTNVTTVSLQLFNPGMKEF